MREAEPKRPDADVESIDFATFIISIATQVTLHLGISDIPELAVHAEVDLDLARHNIDILAMLAQKTRGNLTEEEHHLLQKLLYDLRVQFVEVSEGGA
jgi:hypothetical protein